MSTETDSLPERLHNACHMRPSGAFPWPYNLLREAADRITELESLLSDARAEISNLKKDLEIERIFNSSAKQVMEDMAKERRENSTRQLRWED